MKPSEPLTTGNIIRTLSRVARQAESVGAGADAISDWFFAHQHWLCRIETRPTGETVARRLPFEE